MDKQLSDALVDIIKAGKDGVMNVALFAQQQAPELSKEIVSWGMWSGIAESFIEISLMIIIWNVWINWAGKAWKHDENPLAMMFMVIGAITFVIMFVCFCNSFQQFIKCLVAPKLYLIEYVKHLIGK